MQYFTVTAKTYEEAVKEASAKYGERLRIQSKKDVYSSGLIKRKMCEITCFLSEARVDNAAGFQKPAEPVFEENKVSEASNQLGLFDSEMQVSGDLLEYAANLLEMNDFSKSYCKWMLGEIKELLKKALPDVPTREDIQLSIADKIASSIQIDRKSQNSLPSLTVLLGPGGSGKTTCCAKLCAVLGNGREGGVISCDSAVSAVNQSQKLASALKISVLNGFDSVSLGNAVTEFRNKSYIIVDSVGASLSSTHYPIDFSCLEKNRPKYYIVLPATMKNSDISKVFSLFGNYEISGVIASKTDETSTIGNIISVCNDKKLPLIFISDGKKIPRDFKKATLFGLLSRLNGFSIDFTSWASKDR